MCKSQVGARYLHRCNVRKDKSFTGIVRLANPLVKNIPTIKLSNGTVKRVKCT